jgi:hypothetical protein
VDLDDDDDSVEEALGFVGTTSLIYEHRLAAVRARSAAVRQDRTQPRARSHARS